MGKGNKRIYVECRKAKSGKTYLALMCDFGYRQAIITMDTSFISEITGVSFAELHALGEGGQIEVGLL